MDVFLKDLEYAEPNIVTATREFEVMKNRVLIERFLSEDISPAEAAEAFARRGDQILSQARGRPDAPFVLKWAAPVLILAGLAAAFVVMVRWLAGRARRVARPGPRQRALDRAGYLFASPWIVGFVLFLAGPILAALILGFTWYDGRRPPTWVGAANFWDLLTSDPYFWHSVGLTLGYAAIVVPCGLAVSLALALALAARPPGASLFRLVIYLPHLVAGVAMALALRWFFDADFGLLNAVIGRWARPEWLGPGLIFWTLVLSNVFWVGGSMIVFRAALAGVETELYDAAAVDGAGRVRRFLHVTVPGIAPALLFNLVMSTIYALQVFTEPFVLRKGVPSRSTWFVVIDIWMRGFVYGKYGSAAAVGFLFFLIVAGVVAVEFGLSRRWVFYEAERPG
jgi:multiple sugar transport system permease protein